MAETQTRGRPKPRTIEDGFSDTLLNAGYEMMMQRRDKAAEYLRQARSALDSIKDPDLRTKYSEYLAGYVSRWGKLE